MGRLLDVAVFFGVVPPCDRSGGCQTAQQTLQFADGQNLAFLNSHFLTFLCLRVLAGRCEMRIQMAQLQEDNKVQIDFMDKPSAQRHGQGIYCGVRGR